MRTQGVFQQDTAFPDGQIFVQINPGDATSGTVSLASAGAGLVTTHAGNSQTVVFRKSLNSLLFRYGVQDYAQEMWGSSTGGAQFLATPPATFTTPYGVSGNPPFTGSSQLVPPTSRPKGIAINNIIFLYTVGTDALTTNTFGLSSTAFVNGVAPAVTSIVSNANHGLPTAAAATPYAYAANVNTGMLTNYNAQYMLEWDVTTDSSGTADIYGAILQVSYNFN